MNSEAEITFANAAFFKAQIKNRISIRIMITLITVRSLRFNKHSTDQYAITSIYFNEKNKIDEMIRAKITRKIHFVDELKANMLIENDIFESELFDISMSNSIVYIESCDVIISITIASHRSMQTRFIHSTKTNFISSRSKKLISIHKIFVSNRYYLFESVKTANFSIYAHLMNIKSNSILIRNDETQTLKIFRNFRFEKITESEYINVFQVNTTSSNLTIRSSKSKHQTFWFKKMLTTVNVLTAHVFDDTTVESDKLFNETILFNEIIVHAFSDHAIKIFTNFLDKYFSIWTKREFAKLLEENWMRLFLKSDWENKIKEKVKVYSLNTRDRQVIDNTFDELQNQNKLFYITNFIFFSFSCFVIWKKAIDKKKNRIVVDIKSLNAISQSDAYLISLQFDVLQTIQDCIYIFVMNCVDFFYQWKIHFSNKHKLIVVIHRDQEIFNVIIMSYRNSSSYVQRQIDRVLRLYKQFVKTYIDDIMIFSKSLQEHFDHFQKIFEILEHNNIAVNSKKTYIEYFSVKLLKQHVNFFDLITDKDKLRVIAQFTFSATFEQFETYLKLTNWFKNYIEKYASIFKSLQNKKTLLLKNFSKTDQVRKSYFSKTKVHSSISEKLISFNAIQKILSKFTFLMHFSAARQLYVDLNSSKNEIDDIVYHVRDDQISFTEYSFKKNVQSILFLSRLLFFAEIRYWSIELEVTEFVWILRKIRHLVKFSKHATIVYIDHEATLNIVKQITLFISSIDKLNLRLVRASDYIQRFDLIIKHKSNKLHIVSNVLSRLFSAQESTRNSVTRNSESELNVLFIASLIEMNIVFKDRIMKKYTENSKWRKIIKIIDAAEKIDIKISFIKDNDLIFKKKIENSSFVSRRMCISICVIKNILSMTHDNDHQDFDRTYKKIIFSWYVRNLTKHFKIYIKHCSQCKINQIKRHKSYESLQSILSSSVSFHILIINFVLTLSKTRTDMNSVMSITCKYIKRIIIVSEVDTWNASQWVDALLNRLDFVDWKLSKIIIFDRNRKFLFAFWKALFLRFEVKFLYSIAYHSQFDDAFERINQIIEITLKSLILIINSKDWLTLIDAL